MAEIRAEFFRQVKGRCLYIIWIGDRKASVVFGDGPNSAAVQEAIMACDCALLHRDEIVRETDTSIERRLHIIFPIAQIEAARAKDLAKPLLFKGGKIMEFTLHNLHSATMLERSPL